MRWVLALVLAAGCAETVTTALPASGRCAGIPWTTEEIPEEISPGTFAVRLTRRHSGVVSLPAREGCPALVDAFALRWVPPRSGVAQALLPNGLVLLARVWGSNCEGTPGVCTRAVGQAAERNFIVTAGQPVTLLVSPLSPRRRGLEGSTRDLDELLLRLHLGPATRAYAPCGIVPTAARPGCAPDATCQGSCIPDREVGSFCTRSADCVAGLLCVGSRCEHPETFPELRRCGAGMTECSPGTRCEDGICRAVIAPGGACDPARPCTAGETCIGGRCVPVLPAGAPCEPGMPACAPGTACAPSRDGNRCLPLAPPPCANDPDCREGARCIEGGCVRDGSCEYAPSPQPPRCGVGRWCRAGGEGAPLACVAEGVPEGRCRADGTCDEGRSCLGACGRPLARGAPCAILRNFCNTGDHCGPSAVCIPDAPPGEPGGPCLPGLRCRGAARCDRVDLECVAGVALGERCELDAQCPEDAACTGTPRVCTRQLPAEPPCDPSTPCTAGRSCEDGRCVSPSSRAWREGDACTEDAVCSPGGQCDQRRCRLALPPGARCSAGEVCTALRNCVATGDDRRCLAR